MASEQQAPRAGASVAAGRERHFLPRRSWGSWVIAVLLGLLTLFLALGAVALWVKPNPGEGPGPRLLLSILVLACASGVWFSVRRARSRKPLLTLGQSGITSSKLREPVRWSQLEDVELVQALGNAYLHLKLRNEAGKKPRRGMWGKNAAVRRINLSMLKTDDQFAAYAAIHARLAPWREAAGLGAAPSVKQAHEVTAFEQQLDVLTPTPWALYLVMALNIGVWVLNLVNGISPTKPTPQELFAWGANSAAAVTIDGQYWRLLTATFLHAGLMHLALNMVGLWEAGRQICRWFGNGQFLLIYLGSALAGSALSLHFSSQQSVSVGASGAVFGVLGALLAAVWKHRERIPAATSKQLMTSQGIFVAYALLQGFTKPGIDNAAHVGGLLAGAAITLLLAQQMGQVASAGGRMLRQGLASGVVALAVTLLVLGTPVPKVHHRLLFQSQAALMSLLPRMQAGEQALSGDAQAVKAGKLSADEFTGRVRSTHLPAFQQFNLALQPLAFPAAHPLQPLLEDLRVVYRLIEQALMLEIRKQELMQQIGQLPFNPEAPEFQVFMKLTRDLAENSAQLKAARARLEATVAAGKQKGSAR